MENESVERGNTIYLGTHIVKGNLMVTGEDSRYTLRIGDGPTTEHAISPSNANYHTANRAKVSITNTTPKDGSDNLLISW